MKSFFRVRSRVWCSLALVVFGALVPAARAISNGFTIIKTFDQSGSEPMNTPVEGPGGYLYVATYQGGVNSTGTLFRVKRDGTGAAVIHVFGTSTSTEGNLPWGVMVGADGALYGVTDQGGATHNGTMFKVQPDGSGFTNLHSFNGGNTDGARPQAVPVQDASGMLYGTTYGGGAANLGVVYRVATDGTGFTVLHSFAGGTTDGANPFAGLTLASDGNLYGVAQNGGATNSGIVFRVHPDGTGYTVLYSFAGGAAGAFPRRRLIQASDHALYGTTTGILFKLNLDGTGYTQLLAFAANGSGEPGVIQATDGKLYGATIDGGTSGRGSIYRVNLDGTGFTVLRSFAGGANDGYYAGTAPMQASDGALYGATRFGGPPVVGNSGSGTVYKLNLDGSGAASVVILDGAQAGGARPVDEPIQASDGLLYGATTSGGTANSGTIYQIGLDGSGFKILHHFAGGTADGSNGQIGVMEASDGRLYGVTFTGGTANFGTVYGMNRDGTGYAILHHFTNAGGDGSGPEGRLIQGSDGALYGTTKAGGANTYGTVFKINPDGSGYAILHAFGSVANDGNTPVAGVMQGLDGALYGTTTSGGLGIQGVVYKVNRDGTGYTLLHLFDNSGGGDQIPFSKLIQGSDGALYGTTYCYAGGAVTVGAIYKLNPDGSGYRVLRSMTGGTYDAALVVTRLLRAANGRLYGTSLFGGAYYQLSAVGAGGTIFQIDEDGSNYAINYSFTNSDADGYSPSALMQASNGEFYGVTTGSPSRLGILFHVSLANHPPVGNPQTIAVTPNTPANVTLSASDADGDSLSYIVVTQPAHGTLSGTAPALTYDPGSYLGADSFTFAAYDGATYSLVTTVTLNVGAVSAQTQTLNFPAIPDHTIGDAPFSVTAAASSGLPVTFSVLSGPATISGSTITLTGTGYVTVQASQAGDATYSPVSGTQSFTVNPASFPPSITRQPASHILPFGATAALTVGASGTSPLSYQWYLNGVAISGATQSGYSAAEAGDYTVVVTNATGTITSQVAHVTSAARLVNISGRVRVGTGDDVLILGLVVGAETGSTKRFLVRAAGPSLANYGVGSPLAHPQLTVYAGTNVVATNAGWGTASDPSALAAAFVTTGAFPFANGSADSAALVDLAPGTYSMVVRGADGGTGIAVAEVYELDDKHGQLVNLSARLNAGTGENAAITGFVIGGTQPAKVLVRAVGPGLTAYGVGSVLAKPVLAVTGDSGVIATNQGWQTFADPAAITDADTVSGAFPLVSGSADSAVVVTLAPGRYSALVTGAGGTTAVALIEVYQLP